MTSITVAQDKAGNYVGRRWERLRFIRWINAPTVTQEFTKYNGTDSTTPLPNTDVRLVFSEGIQDAGTNQNLYELYQKVAAGTEPKSKLAGLLRDSIKLYQTRETARPLRLWITRMTRTTGRSITKMW